jgi:pimeloyl-ACP methyl ester carboxylesterase
MSTFCLVHGSTQSPAGWDQLIPALAALGHEYLRVDLPTDRPDLGANAYAAIIAQSLENFPGSIVVAHSASGLFLPLVLQHRKVAALVYLAAVIPQPGESFVSQYNKGPGMYQAGFAGKNPTASEELALHYLLHDGPLEKAP